MSPAEGDATHCATLAHALRMQASERGGQRAYAFLLDGEQKIAELTYAQLDARARALAALLARRGNVVGERALIVLPAGLDYLVAFYGCLHAGVLPVPVYPPRRSRSPERLDSIVDDARPAFCLSSAALRDVLPPSSMEFVAVEEVSLDLADEWRPRDARPEDPAFLQYTSGSLSTPKGVVVTHANLMANQRMMKLNFGHAHDTPLASWLPMYHDMGLIGCVMQPMVSGSWCVLMAPEAFLMKPMRWLRMVSNFRAHTSGGPNFAWELALKKLKPEDLPTLDLSCWKKCVNGAEPVRAETLERFARAFAPAGFSRAALHPCYGLAEATLFVSGTGSRPEAAELRLDASALERNEARPVADGFDGPARRLVGCGVPFLDGRVRIVDPETGAACADRRIGEIQVGGPHVADGYWNRSDETAETFFAEDGTRWLRTGDLGFLDGTELYVAGRLKDLVIVGGKNHYPSDIEKTTEKACDGIRPGGCAAFSVDGAEGEELVLAAELERTALRGTDSDRILADIRRAVSAEHDLRTGRIVLLRPGVLPRTTSGKIRRREARRMYLAGEFGDGIEGP